MASPAKSIAATADSLHSYRQFVNPHWVALLNLLETKVEYERSPSSELFTKDGRKIGFAVRAGLATLDVLERENLGPRARERGEQFRAALRQALAPFGSVKEVRGLGLLSGIEFRAPQKLSLRALYEAFHRIHPAMFGQIIVMRMFRDKNILAQVCGNNFMVLKAATRLWLRISGWANSSRPFAV
jgi:4-aminobutyrate aminotransferase-like enzyme